MPCASKASTTSQKLSTSLNPARVCKIAKDIVKHSGRRRPLVYTRDSTIYVHHVDEILWHDLTLLIKLMALALMSRSAVDFSLIRASKFTQGSLPVYTSNKKHETYVRIDMDSVRAIIFS